MSDTNESPTRPAGTVGGSRSGPSKDGAMECPECHKDLADLNERRKHATLHWGDDLIPPYQSHDEAARRKAALLGVDQETLRGTPLRRW